MKNHYIVKVFLSRILRDCNETTFTMFIDGSKITIIYELMEWIRWLFSLQECFYLAHDSSVIHDFEDIRILSAVKELIIKPCQSECFHKGSHKILFSKINVYTKWECMKVPKIFVEKINDKITLSDSLTTNKSAEGKPKKKNKTSESICANDKRSLLTNEINETDKIQINDINDNKTNSSSKNSNIADDCGKNVSLISENDLKSKKSQKNKKTKKPTFLAIEGKNENDCEENSSLTLENDLESKESKKMLNDVKIPQISLVENQSNVAKKIIPVNHQSSNHENINFLETNIKTEPKSTSPSKHSELFKFSPKPFSIGDLLSSLREENKNNSLVGPSKNDIKINLLENQCSSLPNTSTFDNDLEEPKKKKKRKRRRSKNKLNVEFVNSVTSEADSEVIPEVKSYFEEKKPNHIRFDFDCENESMDMEVLTNQENKDVSKFTWTNNVQKRCCSNLVSTNLDEIKAMLNEKKQTLLNQNSASVSPYERNCSTQTSNGIFTKEDNIIIFEEQSATKFNGCQSSCANEDLKSLIQLKEKFPCPVVIERFY